MRPGGRCYVQAVRAAKGFDARSLEREFLSTRLAAVSLHQREDFCGHEGSTARFCGGRIFRRRKANRVTTRAQFVTVVRSKDPEDLSDECADAGPGLAAAPPRKLSTLEALYRTQAKRLQRIFTRRVPQQDADDLVQETFARYAHAATQRSLAPECPESYLTQVAVNVMRDNWRSAARRGSQQALPIEEVEVPASDLEAALEARDMLNRVEAVMMQLKPMTRAIFIARRFQGYSRAEIAVQTGLSVKAVDKHLGRAVEHLHRHLGDKAHG